MFQFYDLKLTLVIVGLMVNVPTIELIPGMKHLLNSLLKVSFSFGHNTSGTKLKRPS